MTTTLSPFPKEVEKNFLCRLLHQKRPIWDGDYRLDELSGKKIPNVIWVCDICSKSKASEYE